MGVTFSVGTWCARMLCRVMRRHEFRSPGVPLCFIRGACGGGSAATNKEVALRSVHWPRMCMSWLWERPGAPVSSTRKPMRASRTSAVDEVGGLVSYSIPRPGDPPWTRKCKEFGWELNCVGGSTGETSPENRRCLLSPSRERRWACVLDRETCNLYRVLGRPMGCRKVGVHLV